MSTIAERVKERSLRHQPWTKENRMKKYCLFITPMNQNPNQKKRTIDV